jgi:purine-nucleoside phosphorylase
VRRLSPQPARLGIVLGSGFHGVLEEVQCHASIPYSKLPGCPSPSVGGHLGRLISGRLGGMAVWVLAGRAHYYEGHSMQAVTFGIRLLAQLGVESVLLTNAAGGLNPRWRVGDLMLFTDHINLMGANPLRGAADRTTRFVDLTCAYDPQYQAWMRRAARRLKLPLRSGVYLAVSGPSYETPAEIRAFRRLGADAVGMSTVPEVIVARHLGLRVSALSCITNLAAGLGDTRLEHTEVLQVGTRASLRAAQLLQQFAQIYGKS